MDHDKILKLVNEERFEEVFGVPTLTPLGESRRRHRLMLSEAQKLSDDELCTALNKAWATLQAETPKDLLERLCRIGHALAEIKEYDEAIRYLEIALRLPGDRTIARKIMAACLNTRAVENANRAAEMLKDVNKTALVENIIRGAWF